MPSLKMSVVTLPSVPPTSSQCAMQQVKPSSFPSWKIGIVNVKWFRWLPVVYASLVTRMSPGLMFS